MDSREYILEALPRFWKRFMWLGSGSISAYFVGFAILCAASCVKKEDAKFADPKRFSLQFVRQDKQDKMVEVQSGELASLRATVKNTGKEIVRISEVLVSCGCLSATMEPKQLKPEEQGILTYQLDARGKQKEMTATFAVRAQNNKIIPIREDVHIKVRDDVVISPSYVVLGDVIEGQLFQTKISVTLKHQIPRDKVLSYTSSKDWNVETTGYKSNDDQGTTKSSLVGNFLLNLTGYAHSVNGRFAGNVSLELLDFGGRNSVFPIPVTGTVLPVIHGTPDRFFLGYIKSPYQVTKQVTVKHLLGEAISIEGVDGPPNSIVTYKVEDASSSTKNVIMDLNFKRLDSNTSSILLTIKIRTAANDICKLIIPCIYVCGD